MILICSLHENNGLVHDNLDLIEHLYIKVQSRTKTLLKTTAAFELASFHTRYIEGILKTGSEVYFK